MLDDPPHSNTSTGLLFGKLEEQPTNNLGESPPNKYL